MNNTKQPFLFNLVCFIVITVIAGLANVSAEQTYFDKVESANSVVFHYKWRDYQRELQELSFEIDKQSLFSDFRMFRAYKADKAKTYVQRAIQKEFRKNPSPNVQLIFTQQNSTVQIKSNNLNDIRMAQERLTLLEATYQQEYLEKNFYHQFTTYDGVTGIKPDHVKITDLSVPLLKPLKQLILDTVSLQNIRKVTNYVLGFTQSIPYSTLESRVNSSGAGFNPPNKLLWENLGDCDSKMTLAATILRGLMPRIPMVLVFMEQHAFLGIAAEEILPDDITIEIEGIIYILADPTGPSTLPLGTLNFDAEQAILSNLFTTEFVL